LSYHQFFGKQFGFSAHKLWYSGTSGGDEDDYEIKIQKRQMLHTFKK
jgi:hypothetical protein